jgi:hypothetical protein
MRREGEPRTDSKVDQLRNITDKDRLQFAIHNEAQNAR